MHAVSTIKKMELLFIYDKNSFQKLFFAGNAYRKSIPLMMFIEQINPWKHKKRSLHFKPLPSSIWKTGLKSLCWTVENFRENIY